MKKYSKNYEIWLFFIERPGALLDGFGPLDFKEKMELANQFLMFLFKNKSFKTPGEAYDRFCLENSELVPSNDEEYNPMFRMV